MILGLLTIIVLIVIRVPNVVKVTEDPVPLPEVITLPDGSAAASFTQSAEWYAVVTKDDRILIFNRKTGDLQQEIQITSGD